MTHSSIFPALLALQTGGGGFGSLSPFLVQVILILGIFYFFLIRPQQQQKRKHEELLRSIKRGDRVVTFGGIVGEVVHIKDTVVADGATARPMEDEVTIRSAESRLVVERGKIARIVAAKE
ncbi:MAG TPA: preprotein translocase subunit YajC [Gemmatimonadaceae bacterium]|jgi:preprotein translocase subunit YajC|nr:preprotein translocase subunit YajC [Gemmatimonadaceae bacterium]